MFGWYRSQIKEFGMVDATALLWRAGWSRTNVRLANKLLPEKIECPCCGWKGRRFHDYLEVGFTVPQSVCPECDSHARHRLLFLWLEREYPLQDKSGVALVFAPEKALSPVWELASRLQIYTVDLEAARKPSLRADMRQLPMTADSVDLIWCHHVLEHIEDDRAAMRELFRILRPSSGQLIVSVPMEPGTMTREYGFANSREAGHWRMYGDDFADRLMESGFSGVQPVDYCPSADDCARYGINPERFYICTKTAGTN